MACDLAACRLWCFRCLYLGLVPVEADAPVVSERRRVALVLGEVSLFVENLLRLGLVSRHHPDHLAHGGIQYLPDLERQTGVHHLLLCVLLRDRRVPFPTLRWLLIFVSSSLASPMSLEAIIFLFRMARGTSGLGVRSMSVIGRRLTGGAGRLSALEEAWNFDTFM